MWRAVAGSDGSFSVVAPPRLLYLLYRDQFGEVEVGVEALFPTGFIVRSDDLRWKGQGPLSRDEVARVVPRVVAVLRFLGADEIQLSSSP